MRITPEARATTHAALIFEGMPYYSHDWTLLGDSSALNANLHKYIFI